MKDRLTTFLMIAKNNYRVADIVDNLPNLYSIMKCECIDIIERKIGVLKIPYDIVIDDEGKLKKNFITGIGRYNGKVIETLEGIILICKHDNEGELISLNDRDIEYLKASLVEVSNDNLPLSKTLIVYDF